MRREETKQQNNSEKTLPHLSKSVARECAKGNSESMIGIRKDGFADAVISGRSRLRWCGLFHCLIGIRYEIVQAMSGSSRDHTEEVYQNCQRVMERIRAAAARSGREPGEIKLLAACKSQPPTAIRAALRAGVRLLGENYVQEARPKVAAITEAVEWHMIGHLQRNKAREALELFS